MTQDDVQIFKENPLHQANKPVNTTFAMVMRKKKKQISKQLILLVEKKPSPGRVVE